jgi:hypothetical protein
LDAAIRCYTVDLEVMEPDARSSAWVTAQMNLGSLFMSLTSGNRVSNIEQAKLCYEAALSVISREHLPELEDALQFNLAGAWQERLAGNEMENIEKSRNMYGVWHSKGLVASHSLKNGQS